MHVFSSVYCTVNNASMSIYIYKVLISFFGCPIITHEPLTDLPQILIGELGRTSRMFLVWFYDSKLSGFIHKNSRNRNL